MQRIRSCRHRCSVKNAVGIAGVIILLFLCAFPAVKILTLALIYNVCGAVMQPLGSQPYLELPAHDRQDDAVRVRRSGGGRTDVLPGHHHHPDRGQRDAADEMKRDARDLKWKGDWDGMLTWLGSWLRDVISVVLLAAIVDMLLPNKSMQRYARLVTGLIVLLVMLSPLLKLMQGDPQGRLDKSITDWDREVKRTAVKMPSLEEILRKAQETAGSSQEQAVALARTQLESEVAAAVEKETGLSVDSVDASVEWDGRGGGSVKAVTITLAAKGAARGGKASASTPELQEVAPVDVRIDADSPLPGQPPRSQGELAGGDGADPPTTAARLQADGETAPLPAGAEQRIRSLVAGGWQLDPARIQVRQRS